LAIAQPVLAQEEPRMLPFLGEEARKLGHELPEPFGVGLVYYKLVRDIKVTDLRLANDGGPPTSVSQFVDLGSGTDVKNINVKLDAWLLPFLNVYGIVGKVWNKSDTTIDVTLPPLVSSAPGRRFTTTVPTSIEGTVGGLGVTLAGGYKDFFGALDVNWAKADLGFDERFKAVISSARAGWNGSADGRPLRAWANVDLLGHVRGGEGNRRQSGRRPAHLRSRAGPEASLDLRRGLLVLAEEVVRLQRGCRCRWTRRLVCRHRPGDPVLGA
jgi:hypothetical protein